MKNSDISKRDISSFSTIDLQRYILIQGWRELKRTSRAIIFSGPKVDSGREISLKVPISETNTDYFERIHDLITLIAGIKKTRTGEVIRQISLMSHDIFRVRIINPGIFKFSLPLDVAATGVLALKNLFAYAASSEIRPRPYFEQPLSGAVKYANQCQFGHTFEGSFGFTINTPINLPENSYMSIFDKSLEVPFERKVTERVIRGFLNIDDAVKNSNTDVIVDNFETGLNAKMCDALVALSVEKSRTVEFSIEWSPRLPAPDHLHSFSKIMFRNAELDILEEAAFKLKSVEPFNDTIIGPIVTLHSPKEPFLDGEFNRTAIIKHDLDGRRVEVKLELDRIGYEVAYKAHGEGKTVSVEGQLFKKGSSWRMINISEIKPFF